MSLFSITRYTGESEINKEKVSKRHQILNQLNEKALKRKHQFASKSEEKSGLKRQKGEDHSDAEQLDNKKKIDEGNSCISKTTVKSKSSSSVKKSDISDKTVRTPESEDDTETVPEVVKTDTDVVGDVEEKVETDKDSLVYSENEESEIVGTEETDKQAESEELKSFTVIGEVLKRKKQKVERVLPQWLAHPSVVQADIRSNTTPLREVSGIDPQLIQKLKENGIQSYFPVQAQVIPALLDDVRTGFLTGRAGYRPCDICCSAPTGSGKTLAYVLPIVQALKVRVMCQVRALVVLPVRDLALQVFKVFQTYSEGTPLKVGTMVGFKSFQQVEQSLLRRSPVTGQYHSLVDIIVATPGRLVDHINRTEGFSLSHLRFLVIDEADRMMDEIKQDWLAQVERSVYSSTPQGAQQQRMAPGPLTAANIAKARTPLQKLLFSATLSQNPEKLEELGLFQPKLFTSVVDGGNHGNSRSVHQPTGSKAIGGSESSHKDKQEDGGDTDVNSSVSKDGEDENSSIVLSTAVKGEFIGKYTTPSGLTEFYCPCTTSEKPLAMLYFLHHLKFSNVLCFTNSLEVTHRLFWLIKLVGGVTVKEFSSKQHAQKRAKLLTQFKAGKIQVLVCSDAMARGMDVSNVKYVISYESPPFLKTYIHRVGRTARAGKVGTAITLLEKKQIYHFKKMLREAGKTSVKEMRLSKADLKPFVEPLSDSLKQLPDILKSEKMKR